MRLLAALAKAAVVDLARLLLSAAVGLRNRPEPPPFRAEDHPGTAEIIDGQGRRRVL